MRFRNQALLFAVVAIAGAILLWFMSPTITISGEGMRTSNKYYWWFAGAYLVAVGCALEYFWMPFFTRLSTRLPQKQMFSIGSAMITVSLIALFYGLIKYYHSRLRSFRIQHLYF